MIEWPASETAHSDVVSLQFLVHRLGDGLERRLAGCVEAEEGIASMVLSDETFRMSPPPARRSRRTEALVVYMGSSRFVRITVTMPSSVVASTEVWVSAVGASTRGGQDLGFVRQSKNTLGDRVPLDLRGPGADCRGAGLEEPPHPPSALHR